MNHLPTTNCHPACSPRRPGILESLLLLVIRAGLAAVFAFAAYNKLINPQSFVESIKAFDILPDHLTVLAAFGLPWAEGLCALLLLFGFWTRAAALVLSIQLAVFVAGILSVIIRNLDVTCGCFGKYDFLCSGPLGWCNVGQNAILLIASLLVLYRGPGSASIDRALESRA